MMRFVYKQDDVLKFAEFDLENGLNCDDDLRQKVDVLVALGDSVHCAEIDFLMPASLETDVQAWGTISSAIQSLPYAQIVDRPPNQLGFVEDVNSESVGFDYAMMKAKFASRSEAGRYAAHIRWSRNSGVEPLTPDKWREQQGGAVVEPTVSGRKTPTGRDWDEKPPVFATMSEALDWLNAKWSPAEGPDRFLTDGGSLPDWAANTFASSMDDMFKDIPEVCTGIFSISWEPKDLGGGATASGWAGRTKYAYVGFSPSQFRMTFVKGGITDPSLPGRSMNAEEFWIWRCKERFADNHSSTASPNRTFYHEVGHHIGYQAGNTALYGNKGKVVQSLWKDSDDRPKYDRALMDLVSPIIRRVYGLPGRGRVKLADLRNTQTQKDLSRYGLTNYDEFVAECASQYFAAKFEPGHPPATRIAVEVTEGLLEVIRSGKVPKLTKNSGKGDQV